MARRVRIRREGRRPCDTERQSLMTSSLSAVLQALELGHLDLMGDQRSMEAPPPAEALEQTVSAIWSDLFALRSEEHTSELQSLMRISYAVFCLKKKKHKNSER